MFDNLTDKIDKAFKILKGQGQITEINVAETLKEVRRALLDADVNYKTAKDFTSRVKERALGEDVLTSISPGQLMIKITKDELADLMGGEQAEINLSGKPAVILMSGLQGSGHWLYRRLQIPSRRISESRLLPGVSPPSPVPWP